MSDSNVDKVLDKIGANDDFREAVKTGEGIVSTISDAVAGYKAAYETGKTLLVALGFLEKDKDPLAELGGKIDALTDLVRAKFTEVLNTIHAEAALIAGMEIAPYIAKARTAVDVLLPHVMPDGTKTPEFESLKHDADVESLEALNALDLPVYWRRVYYEPWVFVDPMSGPMRPPADSKGGMGTVVFEYRLVLPAFLEVVARRIAVIGLIGRDPLKHDPPFKVFAARLLERHDTILKGIVALRAPTEDEIAPSYAEYIPATTATEFHRREPHWSLAGRIYGAAEVYSGSADTAAYPPLNLPELPQPPSPTKLTEDPWENANPVTAAAFRERVRRYWERHARFMKEMATYTAAVRAAHARLLPRHALRSLWKRKRLYAAIGLPAMWRTVNHLLRLGGEPPVGICDFGAWSLRDADGVVRQATGAASPSPGASISLRDAASKAPANVNPFTPFAAPGAISLLGLAGA